MSDDYLYILASLEVYGREGTKRDDALWQEALALSEGDQERAGYRYINLRVEQLAGEHSGDVAVSAFKASRNALTADPNYISIAKFSAKNTVSEKHLIQNIENGYYQGKQVDGVWWIYVGKNTFGTFAEREESFFSAPKGDKSVPGRPGDPPGKVISIGKKK